VVRAGGAGIHARHRCARALEKVRSIRYDFDKYGKQAERERLVDRWLREVESLLR
jgi:hypothetical protein